MINAISFTIVMVKFMIYHNNEQFLYGSYYFIVLLAAGYATLNIVLLAFPQILYGLPFELLYLTPSKISLPQMEPINDVVLEGKLNADDTNEAKKISPQFYSQDYIVEIEALLQIAKNEKLLLQPNFLLEDLNSNSSIPTHHLSYYFNNIAKVKFAHWRNEFRVEHAIELLKKGTLDSVNFKWIASNSGFSSSTTFFRVFKIHTTYTPTEYLLSLNDCKKTKELLNPPDSL
jgi:AraC-like DNA-binding protein